MGDILDKILAVIFSSEAILGYLLTGIAVVWGVFKKKIIAKEERAGKAFLYLEQGVEDAWQGFVKEAKKNSADGKLSADERKKAFNYAKTQAVDYAKKSGWNLFKYVAEEVLPIVIKNIVNSRKLKSKKA